MAVWISTGSTDYNVPSNWDGGLVPNGADIIFRGSESIVGCLANVDRTSDALYDRIITEPDYSGLIGSPQNPLHIGINNVANTHARAIHRGTGLFNLKVEVGSSGGDVVVDSMNFAHAMTLTGHCRNLAVKSGGVRVLADPITGYIVLNGINATVGLIVGTVLSGSGIAVYSGFLSCAVDVSASHAILVNGTMEMTGRFSTDVNITVGASGRLIYKPTTAPGGTHLPNIVVNGELDLTQSRYDLSAKIGRLVIGPNGLVRTNGTLAPTKSLIDLRQEYP